jgi:hypothetical protein
LASRLANTHVCPALRKADATRLAIGVHSVMAPRHDLPQLGAGKSRVDHFLGNPPDAIVPSQPITAIARGSRPLRDGGVRALPFPRRSQDD